MATTQTVLGIPLAKGPHSGAALLCYEVAVKVSGTYLTASKPNFDVLAALQAQHEGISAVAVKRVTAWQDGNDGSTIYTASNAVIALSGTGNKVTTFTIESGATNGDTGTEIADGTALNHVFSFLVVCTVTE